MLVKPRWQSLLLVELYMAKPLLLVKPWWQNLLLAERSHDRKHSAGKAAMVISDVGAMMAKPAL